MPRWKIQTANDLRNVIMYGGYRRWVEMLVDAHFRGAKVTWETRGEPVLAQIWRSAWVVSCPDCPGAIRYEPGEPFFCTDCLNGHNQGYARPVRMPESRQQIESVLLMRPVPNNCNYLPYDGEDLAFLIAENIVHGDPVPPGIR